MMLPQNTLYCKDKTRENARAAAEASAATAGEGHFGRVRDYRGLFCDAEVPEGAAGTRRAMRSGWLNAT